MPQKKCQKCRLAPSRLRDEDDYVYISSFAYDAKGKLQRVRRRVKLKNIAKYLAPPRKKSKK